MTKKYTAQCACGACKFGFDTDPTFIANCHCNDCKRASGGAMATFFGVPADDFTKRRLPWAKALDLPQFPGMPG